MLGEEVKIGNLIAFSKYNKMEFGIVIQIGSEQIGYLTKYQTKKYINIEKINKSGDLFFKKIFDGYGDWKAKINYIYIEKEKKIQNRLFLISDPLFRINNESIAAQFEIIELAKSQNLLPKNYILGNEIE